MKKCVILFFCSFIISISSAQIKPSAAIVTNDTKQVKLNTVWEVTFDEETPEWIFGQNQGEKTWTVSDTTPSNGFSHEEYGEVPPLWIYIGQRYVHDYSESGGRFAWIDGISDLLELFPCEVFDSYIQFNNIDLTGVENPEIEFYQNYKPLNDSYTILDLSVDGGENWDAIELNEWTPYLYGPDFYTLDVSEYIANQSNVSLRFILQTTEAGLAGYTYGWEIDDVKIINQSPSSYVIDTYSEGLNDFSIYPDPVAEILYLNIPYENLTVKLFDCNGTVINNSLKSNSNEINVSFLSSGLYYIVIYNEDGIIGKSKFIKM